MSRAALLAAVLAALPPAPAPARPVRLKDVLRVKGVRENPILGYGVVIGLNGTGDGGGGDVLNQSFRKVFATLGLDAKDESASKNVASVIVTAKLPPFGRVGQRVDATVSSIGDASSLSGGTLLVTPLKSGNGDVYAIASGPLSVGGLVGGKRFPTTAVVSGGAIVEKELDVGFDEKTSIRLSLHEPDFTTAARVERTINEELGGKYAISRDAATVDLMVPANYRRRVVQLMALVENFTVNTDSRTRIVINERTGTVVAGGDVVVKPVAVSHGDLSVEVKDGDEERSDRVHYVGGKATLADLVEALNAFGASPEDLIAIFMAMRRNGALSSEIELM